VYTCSFLNVECRRSWISYQYIGWNELEFWFLLLYRTTTSFLCHYCCLFICLFKYLFIYLNILVLENVDKLVNFMCIFLGWSQSVDKRIYRSKNICWFLTKEMLLYLHWAVFVIYVIGLVLYIVLTEMISFEVFICRSPFRYYRQVLSSSWLELLCQNEWIFSI